MSIVQATSGRILVIRGGALGDFILTLPVLAALRQQFPNVGLSLMAYPQYGILAMEAGLVNDLCPIEGRALAGFFGRNASLDPAMSDYFSDFDLFISYLYDPDEIFRSNLARVSQASLIQCPHRPDEALIQHAAEQLLAPLQRLGIFDVPVEPRLGVEIPDSTSSALAVHPGSGSERKNWPEDRWMEFLFRWVADSGRKVLLVGGEAEGQRLRRMADALPPGQVQLAESLPLPVLKRHLSSCAGFLGHDSGISHLAAALGLPGLVLWGPSNVQIWRPLSRRFDLLVPSGGLENLRCGEVLDVLEPLWRKWGEAPDFTGRR